MKILIVDDSEPVRVAMEGILSTVGRCRVAHDGCQAVDRFQEALDASDPYDVIFMDIMMPEMDGQEALKNMRAIEAARGIYGQDGVRVVMVTAVDDPESILEAYNEDCETYLIKPAGREKILKALAELGLTPSPAEECANRNS